MRPTIATFRKFAWTATIGLEAITQTARIAATYSLTDKIMFACGVAIAGASTTFAGYMTMRTDRTPLVNGIEYLAIFAQPQGASQSASAQDPSNRELTSQSSTKTYDLSPTASISVSPTTDEKTEIIGGTANLVWLRRGQAILAVKVGDVIAGTGQVGAIQRRGGRWELLGNDGDLLLQNGRPTAETPKPPLGRFERSLIFRDQER